ncbi:MAG: hypothetical protein ACRD15_19055, partial [Vicinamibacterales bacterium]
PEAWRLTMKRIALATLAMVASLVAAPAAEGLTTRDILELSRAGLGEDVLLALIEVDRGVYAIDPATLKSLKAAGVSERVILALVRSGREQPIPEPPAVVEAAVEEPAPQPQVVVIEHEEPPPVREVMVPVPVYVTVPSVPSRHRRVHHVDRTPTESTFVPFQFGLPAVRPTAHQPKKPVYWGFGGKLRPDAWKPNGHKPDHQKRDRE